MDFLKRLFGGGASRDTSGMYFYIRSRRSGEIIRLRLDLNQLSPEYEGERISGYYTHKTLVGQRSFERLEADFTFDASKRLLEKSVTGGEFVTREDWLAQQEGGHES
ncbi:MAG: hypothetical protein HPY64_09770 [Anaerolineae bacterium]|nr:hypothetical protein [Anaerolineae bacterium]